MDDDTDIKIQENIGKMEYVVMQLRIVLKGKLCNFWKNFFRSEIQKFKNSMLIKTTSWPRKESPFYTSIASHFGSISHHSNSLQCCYSTISAFNPIPWASNIKSLPINPQFTYSKSNGDLLRSSLNSRVQLSCTILSTPCNLYHSLFQGNCRT